MSEQIDTLAILPQPASITRTQGTFQFTRETVIVSNDQTRAVAHLLVQALAPALGFTPGITDQGDEAPSTVILTLDTAQTGLGQEGYTLEVTPQQVTLLAAQLPGLFYATQTLRQLLPADIFSPEPVAREWLIPALTIEDAPDFSWRGCMLDTARHFIPRVEILKFIDLLALHKINTLHLHLTDDQGWRIEIKKYPRLTELGSQRKETVIGHARNPQGYDGKAHGGFYTQEELNEIVVYAAARYITILPEIDIPGHAQAALTAYPEFGVTGKTIDLATTWGIHPYLFNTNAQTIQFLKDVFSEVMQIFPGPYIHLGGDEAIKDQWKASTEVQTHIKELGLKDEDDMQSWFLSQIGTFIIENGRRFIGWDEILEGGLPAGAAVMSWRGFEGGIAAAQAGHDVIMAPQSHVYLDHYQSNDPAEPQGIGGYSPLEKVYSFQPIPDTLTEEQTGYILGGQCNIWTEYIPTSKQLEYMAFPRAIALAEVTWTPEKQRDFNDFTQRLAYHESRLKHLKVTFRPVATLEQEQKFPARSKQ